MKYRFTVSASCFHTLQFAISWYPYLAATTDRVRSETNVVRKIVNIEDNQEVEFIVPYFSHEYYRSNFLTLSRTSADTTYLPCNGVIVVSVVIPLNHSTTPIPDINVFVEVSACEDMFFYVPVDAAIKNIKDVATAAPAAIEAMEVDEEPTGTFQSTTLIGTQAKVAVPVNLSFGETVLSVKDLLMRETFIETITADKDKVYLYFPNGLYVDSATDNPVWERYFELYYRCRRGGHRIRFIPYNYTQIKTGLVPAEASYARNEIFKVTTTPSDFGSNFYKYTSAMGCDATPFIGSALTNYSYRVPQMSQRPFYYTQPRNAGVTYEEEMLLACNFVPADGKSVTVDVFTSVADDFMFTTPIGVPMFQYYVKDDPKLYLNPSINRLTEFR